MLQGQASYAIAHRTPHEQALAELRQITERPDLLARAAGIIAGAARRESGDWRSMRREWVRLLLDAGADPNAFREWVRVGIDNRQRMSYHRMFEPRPHVPVTDAQVAEVLADVFDG